MRASMIHTCIFSLPLLLLVLPSFAAGFNQKQEEDEDKEIKRSNFPHGFLFGAATSAYQIEGAYLEDGRSLSNWDAFCRIKNSIKDGANGDVADDHYHRYLEDIDIMHNLGVNAYRFSIAWTRILPNGRFGEVNRAGITFYNKIINNLLDKGIEPFVTIHHHDYPQELEERYKGWLSPIMQEEFLYFSKICFEYFGDRVKYWATINEPNLFAEMAYEKGTYPPGHCSQPFGNCSFGNSDVEPLLAVHNMLLGHAKAAKLYRDRFQAKQGGFIGIVVHMFMYEALTDDELDRDAANRVLAFKVAWALDPLVFGDYPPEMRRYHGTELPNFSPEEKKILKGSIDFVGVNHYGTLYTKDCIHSSCIGIGNRVIEGLASRTELRNGVPIGEPTGMQNFYVVPRGMEEIINYVKNRYHNMPMFVTENGYSKKDELVEEVLNDGKRIEFHKSYLLSLARAINGGADVRGYFVWTLMDDFEWVFGYGTRFGLYYVDPLTLDRKPKLSAKWYEGFLNNNRTLIMMSQSQYKKKATS